MTARTMLPHSVICRPMAADALNGAMDGCHLFANVNGNILDSAPIHQDPAFLQSLFKNGPPDLLQKGTKTGIAYNGVQELAPLNGSASSPGINAVPAGPHG